MYVILALLALGFLILIHEFGHYFMAKWVGIKVDVFSVGLGKAIWSKKIGDTLWQIGWIPFGGYVQFHGAEKVGRKEPHQIPGGFFNSTPWDRIRVSFMGPFVNLVFAFIVFFGMWTGGGRTKMLSEFTGRIGWIDQKSELYAQGVRVGDQIEAYDGKQLGSARDHLIAPMVAGDDLEVSGYRIDDETGKKTAFKVSVKPYQNPLSPQQGILTAGILQPAQHVVYDPRQGDQPFPEGSPMANSGIAPKDRILWVDGHEVFSTFHLVQMLNENRALLTVVRGDQELHARVPRVAIADLKLDGEHREELFDWQFEAKLKSNKLANLLFCPYNLNADCVVESPLALIDPDRQSEAFPDVVESELEEPLRPGDRIVAVDGQRVEYSYELLTALQNRRVHVIVQETEGATDVISYKEVNDAFDQGVDRSSLHRIAGTIGGRNSTQAEGGLRLLNPVEPKKRIEFFEPERLANAYRDAEAMEDPDKRREALAFLKKLENEWVLGIPHLRDRKVTYNPDPMTLFMRTTQEIWTTLSALFTGALSPKWVSGPVGIVQIIQDRWEVGLMEVLYWLGMISLNLAVLNLLPIPILDGGKICIFAFEWVTGRQLKPKTVERLIFPFMLLLIFFFLFITYHDIVRLAGHLLR